MKKISLLDFEPYLKGIHLSNVIVARPEVDYYFRSIKASIFENVIFFNYRFEDLPIHDVRFINCMFINVYFEEVFFYDCEFNNVVINDSFITETYFFRGRMTNLNLCYHGKNWDNLIEGTKVDSSIIDVNSEWKFSDVTFENSITIIGGQVTKY